MQQKKDLDQLFSSLAELDVQAPEASWDHIAQGLDRKRKKRRALWWWTYGAAASLFIGWGGATLWTSQQNPTKWEGVHPAVEPITAAQEPVTPTQRNPNHRAIPKATSSKASDSNASVAHVSSTPSVATQPTRLGTVTSIPFQVRVYKAKDKSHVATASSHTSLAFRFSQKRALKSKSLPTDEREIFQQGQQPMEVLVAEHSAQRQEQEGHQTEQVMAIVDVAGINPGTLEAGQGTAATDSTALTSAQLLVEAEKGILTSSKEAKPKPKIAPTSKWLVGPVFNPVVQNAFGNESPIDPKLTDNTKQFKSASTFGVQVQWAVDDHFGLRTGIHQAQMEFSTQNVYITEGFETTQLANLNANGLTFVQINGSAAAASALNKNGSSTGFSANLNQRFRFVEIPIEGVYCWKQRKWLFQLSGGVSTYWMQENRLYLDSPSMQMNLGEASNANKWHYSGNIGAGIGWEALPKVVLGVEPYFKYQWNTYSSNTRFTPYTLGAYFGVKYRF